MVVPINKAVIDTFKSAPRIQYAKHDDGSLYISNGQYLLKTNQAGIDRLTGQVNKYRKASGNIAVTENPRLLSFVDKAKGTFELSQKPYEMDSHYFFADDRQYYGYNKKYVDVFDNDENRLFIDDNTNKDPISNGLIVKSRDNEVLGLVMPIRIPETLQKHLADKLPFVKAKTPARDGNGANFFIYMKQSPWGEVKTCDKLCPGVFTVSTEKHGGIMVSKDMTAALSPAAAKCGVKHNGYLCFENNHAKYVVFRELLDKKLWAVPDNVKDKAAYEENINKSIREHNPEYWRTRQQGRERLNVRQAPAHAGR